MTKKQYVDRLYDEWVEHSKIIIGLDYHDTISPWKSATQEECNKVIKVVRLAKETGAYIVIHSCCDKKEQEEIIKYCNLNGIDIDSINVNPFELPYGNDKEAKPYCNIYLDDRAGLTESIEILSLAMFRLRSKTFCEQFKENNIS